MTIRDLLEFASLDALGLLDDDERIEFEAAFRAASPEVQAQVRREQRRAAGIESILPDVEAPVGLRARVLDAVRRAIVEVSTPVASLQPVGDQGHRRAFGRATPVWRAACIGFATATIVLSGAFGWMRAQNMELATAMTSNQVIDLFQDNAGARALDILAAKNVNDVAMVPAADDVAPGVTANLYLNADTGEAILVCKGLRPTTESYRLVIEDGAQQKRVKEFQSPSGGMIPVLVRGLTPQDLRSLAIIAPDAEGGPEKTILRSTGA